MHTKVALALLTMHLEVCASSGSAQQSVMGRTKWPATYTRHFALGIQLPPALQSPFSFHLGCGYAQKKKITPQVERKELQ